MRHATRGGFVLLLVCGSISSAQLPSAPKTWSADFTVGRMSDLEDNAHSGPAMSIVVARRQQHVLLAPTITLAGGRVHDAALYYYVPSIAPGTSRQLAPGQPPRIAAAGSRWISA